MCGIITGPCTRVHREDSLPSEIGKMQVSNISFLYSHFHFMLSLLKITLSA